MCPIYVCMYVIYVCVHLCILCVCVSTLERRQSAIEKSVRMFG
jgi:hypothetical protein